MANGFGNVGANTNAFSNGPGDVNSMGTAKGNGIGNVLANLDASGRGPGDVNARANAFGI